ncbi:MAG: hypothetical protein ABI763_05605 [Bacteroidota bacterium]
MGIPHIILEADRVYHVYNSAVGSDKLFKESKNYHYFLRKYFDRITPFSETLAFCLLPDQFHFILRIKNNRALTSMWGPKIQKLKKIWNKIPDKETANYLLINHLVIHEFASLFNGYVQAFNKMYQRNGTLLRESFRRDLIESDVELINKICELHNYPVLHGCVKRRADWKHSSYNNILSLQNPLATTTDVLKQFGGKKNFLFLHDSR